MAKAQKENKTPEFEESMEQLHEILEKISDEGTPLRESISLYAKAAELIEICQTALDTAQVEIEEIGKRIVLPEETDEF